MNRVWEHADYKESTLLLLLALADFADDNGICWPEIPTLTAKARISDRRATDIIQTLEHDGAIVYQRGGGRGRRSLYGVLIGLTEDQKERVKLIHRNYFSENKTVKSSAKGEETSPITEKKGELQRKEKVNYSVNSDVGLTEQNAPNVDPIRHVDPSYKNLERESDLIRDESPARTPAVQAYFEVFSSQSLSATQVAEINAVVKDIAKWKDVLKEWELNNWSARGIGKMLDRYKSGRTAADERPGDRSNGHAPARAAPQYQVVSAADRPKKQVASLEDRKRILGKRHDTS